MKTIEVDPLYVNVLNTFKVLHREKNFEYFVKVTRETLTTTDIAVRCFDLIFSLALEDKNFTYSFAWLANTLEEANVRIGEFILSGTVRKLEENSEHLDAKITYSICQITYSHTLRLESGDVVGGFVTTP